MLGVARPAMHLAVRTLQQAGLVRYARVRDAYGI
jgi:Mn-dependent DtxR family transcriptional regulator